MLILVPGQVVGAVLVSPVDGLGEIRVCKALPGVRSVLDRSVFELRLGDGAALPAGEEFLRSHGAGGWVELGLRERVDGVVVFGIVPLFIGGLVPFLSGPGVLGGSPSAR